MQMQYSSSYRKVSLFCRVFPPKWWHTRQDPPFLLLNNFLFYSSKEPKCVLLSYLHIHSTQTILNFCLKLESFFHNIQIPFVYVSCMSTFHSISHLQVVIGLSSLYYFIHEPPKKQGNRGRNCINLHNIYRII